MARPVLVSAILGQALVSSARNLADKHDLRWARIGPTTMVCYDGRLTTWGRLSESQKDSCVLTDDGSLEGPQGRAA